MVDRVQSRDRAEALLAEAGAGGLRTDGQSGQRNTARVVETFTMLTGQQGCAVMCFTHDPGVAATSDVEIGVKDGRIMSALTRSPSPDPIRQQGLDHGAE